MPVIRAAAPRAGGSARALLRSVPARSGLRAAGHRTQSTVPVSYDSSQPATRSNPAVTGSW